GTVAPGDSPGMLTTGDVAFNASTHLAIQLNGTTPATSYDQLAVHGTVDLGGAVLDVSVGYTPTTGDTFAIVDNDGTDAVTGTIFNSITVSGDGYTLAGNSVSLMGGFTANASSGNDTVSLVVGGDQGVTKSGASTLVLSGANTYTGATLVDDGILNIQSSSAL